MRFVVAGKIAAVHETAEEMIFLKFDTLQVLGHDLSCFPEGGEQGLVKPVAQAAHAKIDSEIGEEPTEPGTEGADLTDLFSFLFKAGVDCF